MKIEEQVVSLKYAREMKELGAKQDSVWYWIHCNRAYRDDWSTAFLVHDTHKITEETCSAFTVAELGEMLKQHAKHLPVWNKHNTGTKWYSEIYTEWHYCLTNQEREADARAIVWIFLKQEGMIEK